MFATVAAQTTDPAIQAGIDQLKETFHTLGTVAVIVALVTIIVLGVRARHEALHDSK